MSLAGSESSLDPRGHRICTKRSEVFSGRLQRGVVLYLKMFLALQNEPNVAKVKGIIKKTKIPWPLVRKQTIPTERPPLVGEVSANFCG
jgi:hypothetical protein